ALALSYLGTICEYQGGITRAESLYNEGVAAARRAGDLAAISDGLLRLGRLALSCGDYQGAAAAMAEALSLSQTIGYQAYVALAQRQLARVDLARWDLAEAHANV